MIQVKVTTTSFLCENKMFKLKLIKFTFIFFIE